MTPQDRILDAAMRVFRRHGFRRSSIEQAAEAAGLTRQALYHHFQSKEALFRAVIEQLFEGALAAEIAAADAAEKTGGGLADILVAQVNARLRHLIASFEGSPHIEELFSEHLALCREMAMHGTKSAYPSMLPADAFLGDLNIMLRTLVTGALAPSKQRPTKTAPARKSKPGKSGKKPGGRR